MGAVRIIPRNESLTGGGDQSVTNKTDKAK